MSDPIDIILGTISFVVLMSIPVIFVYFLLPFPRKFRKGVKFLKEEEYDEALDSFNYCLGKRPDELHSLFNRGLTLVYLKKYIDAENDGHKLIKLYPDKIQGYTLLLYIYNEQLNGSGLVSIAEQFLVKGNNKADALCGRGIGYIHLKQYELALDDLTEAKILLPKNAIIRNNLGYVLIKMGDPDSALEELNEAIILDPKLDFAYSNRGLAYSYMSDYVRAFKDFDTAMELDNKNGHLYFHIGITNFRLNDYENAKKNFNRALIRDQNLKKEIAPYLEKMEPISLK